MVRLADHLAKWTKPLGPCRDEEDMTRGNLKYSGRKAKEYAAFLRIDSTNTDAKWLKKCEEDQLKKEAAKRQAKIDNKTAATQLPKLRDELAAATEREGKERARADALEAKLKKGLRKEALKHTEVWKHRLNVMMALAQEHGINRQLCLSAHACEAGKTPDGFPAGWDPKAPGGKTLKFTDSGMIDPTGEDDGSPPPPEAEPEAAAAAATDDPLCAGM